MEKPNFIITINDNFCTYEYPLNISRNNSIDKIVKKIYKAFKLKKQTGRHIPKSNLINELEEVINKYK